MKKTRLLCVILLSLLTALCLGVFCACDEEDVPQPQPQTPASSTVVLDAGEGGTLKDGSNKLSLTAEVGKPLKEVVADLVPAANAGYTFEGWFFGEAALDDQTVSEQGNYLDARYSVGYTVELYFEDTDGSYREPEKVTGTGTLGKPFTYTPAREHFAPDESRYARLSTESLIKDDLFAVYMARDRYDLLFSDEVSGETQWCSVVYGTGVICGDRFAPTVAHRFSGWTETIGGPVKYTAEDEIVPAADMVLYAVWDEAYTDRMGGGDLIYLPAMQEGVAILDRAGIEFTGAADANGIFTFETENGQLKGKTDAGTRTFQYADRLKAGKYLYYDRYFEAETPVDEQTTLELDAYGAGTLTVNGTTYQGAVYYDAFIGDYVFAVDENTAAYFITAEQDGKLYFTLQGEEMGMYTQHVSFGSLFKGNPGDFTLTVDGYGHAIFYDTYYKSAYPAEYAVDLANSSESALCLHAHVDNRTERDFLDERSDYVDTYVYLFTFDEELIFLFENRTAKGTFTKGEDTLVLDGFGGFIDSATYTAGGKTVKGSYYAYESELFDTVVEMKGEDGKNYYFSITGGLKPAFTVMAGKVTEYWRLIMDEYFDSDLVGPILVVCEEEDGVLPTDLYAEVNGEFAKVGTGSCTLEQKGSFDVYTFTLSKAEEGMDASGYQTIVFLATDLFDANVIMYHTYQVYSLNGNALYTTLNGTGDNAGEQIWFADFDYTGVGAFYKTKSGDVLYGSFELGKGGEWFEDEVLYGVFRYDDGVHDTYQALRFAIGGAETALTFSQIPYLPYRLYSTDETHNYWFDNLCLGNDGEAQFNVQDASENDLGVVKGAYREVDKTAFGDPVYLFEPEANEYGEYTVKEFRFVIEEDYVYGYYNGIALTHKVYHVPYETKTYETEDGGKLEGDGFWYRGRYVTAAGVEVEGLFYCGRGEDKGKILLLETDGMTLIFDILANGKLSLRDGLDGYYEVLDDNSDNYQHWAFELDGHGNLTVEDTWNYTTLYSGAYALSEEYGMLDVTLNVTGSVAMQFKIYLIVSGNASVAVLVNEERGLYTDGDLSVLYIDGLNVNSYYIDAFGMGHAGDYYLFGDGYGAFNYSDGSEVFVFTYDPAAKTFSRKDYSSYYATYYAGDFSAAYVLGKTVTTDEYAGYWYVEGNALTMQLIRESTGAMSTKKGAFNDDGTLTIGYYETYYRLTGEQVFTGKVTLNYQDKDSGLTLKFTPNGEGTFTVDAYFIDETHTGLSVKFTGWSIWLTDGNNDYYLTLDVETMTFVVELDYDYEYEALMGKSPNSTTP